MNFDQRLVFDLVAQHGSLSRAAKISHQAQSLISRKLAQLEQDWGDRLFHRTGRGVGVQRTAQAIGMTQSSVTQTLAYLEALRARAA